MKEAPSGSSWSLWGQRPSSHFLSISPQPRSRSRSLLVIWLLVGIVYAFCSLRGEVLLLRVFDGQKKTFTQVKQQAMAAFSAYPPAYAPRALLEALKGAPSR